MFIAVVLLLIAVKPLLIVLPLLLTALTLLLTASPLLLTVVGVVEIPLVALSRCRVALTPGLLDPDYPIWDTLPITSFGYLAEQSLSQLSISIPF